MSHQDRETLYSYHWPTRVVLYGWVLLLAVLVLFLTVGFLAGLVQLLSGAAIEPGFLGGLVFMVLVLATQLIYFANSEPNIRISDRGIAVQAFLFWYVLVPWRDVKEVRKTSLFFSKSGMVPYAVIPARYLWWFEN